MPHQRPGNRGGSREVVSEGLQVIREKRKRQANQKAGDRKHDPRSPAYSGTGIIGGPMHQDGHRKEQPHEIILPGQRRGHRHQAEQDTEFLGVGPGRPARTRRHHGDESKPDRDRNSDHDPIGRLEIEIDQIHVCGRLGRIILVVVDRPRQAMRHCDDRLVDPRPVLLAALSETLLRTRSNHSLVPGPQFGNVVLKAAHRRRNHEQKNSEEYHHARRRCPLSSPKQIGKYGYGENLDRGRQRKHAS